METPNKETEVPAVEPQTNQETEVVKPSPVEEAARATGWVSKEEWEAQGKDPSEWRTAREYQERGELFDEIHKLKDVNKKTAAAFKVLVEHHKKVRETAVAEALAKLKAEKKEALANHEIERVYALDEQIDRVRQQPLDVPHIDVPEVETGPTPTFRTWHKRNDWYELSGDHEASRFADAVGYQLKSKNPDISESDLLEQVESKVARRFPELFENENSRRPSEVNPRSETKSSGPTIKLSEAEERVCKMLVEQGVMTRKQYIDEIKKTRGL
jgi:hypothetical protein